MTIYRVQTILPAVSGLPEDVIVMDHYFVNGAGADATKMDHMGGAVASACVTARSSDAKPLGWFLGHSIDRTVAPKFEVYALPNVAGPAGSPVYTGTWAGPLDAADASADLPREAAVCLSFHADYGTAVEEASDHTRPRARLRGRTYFGPWNGDALDGTTARVSPKITSLLLDLGKRLRDNADLTLDGTDWVVFSKRTWSGHKVKTVWVDNEFDTVRRRGLKSTVRVSDTAA